MESVKLILIFQYFNIKFYILQDAQHQQDYLRFLQFFYLQTIKIKKYPQVPILKREQYSPNIKQENEFFPHLFINLTFQNIFAKNQVPFLQFQLFIEQINQRFINQIKKPINKRMEAEGIISKILSSMKDLIQMSLESFPNKTTKSIRMMEIQSQKSKSRSGQSELDDISNSKNVQMRPQVIFYSGQNPTNLNRSNGSQQQNEDSNKNMWSSNGLKITQQFNNLIIEEEDTLYTKVDSSKQNNQIYHKCEGHKTQPKYKHPKICQSCNKSQEICTFPLCGQECVILKEKIMKKQRDQKKRQLKKIYLLQKKLIGTYIEKPYIEQPLKIKEENLYKKPRLNKNTGQMQYGCSCNKVRCDNNYCGCFINKLGCTPECNCVHSQCQNKIQKHGNHDLTVQKSTLSSQNGSSIQVIQQMTFVPPNF